MAHRELRIGDTVRISARMRLTMAGWSIDYSYRQGRVDSTTLDGLNSVLVSFGPDVPAATFHPSELEIIE